MSTIGKTLKHYRNLRSIKVDEVIEMFERNGIKKTANVIYNWENDENQPNPTEFLLLCKMYKIEDILGEFGYVNKKTPILSDEQEVDRDDLIKLYDQSSPEIQDAAVAVLMSRAMSEKDQDTKK